MHIVSSAFKIPYKISMCSNLKTRDSTRSTVLTTSAVHETPVAAIFKPGFKSTSPPPPHINQPYN